MTTPIPVYKITNVNLIDVEKGIVVPGQTITIAGNRVDRIGLPAGPDVPERTHIIDAQGLYLMLPGIFPGYSVHEEMAIWQEAGISPADVLRSATLTPARFMGLGDRLGSVSAGKTASLVLVRANPLEDIRNAQQIESVFLRGKYFSHEDLARLLEEARTLAQQATPGS
jgi:imidazolonepropionase-like amidohydrolase